jgi:hypothetical protein
MATFAIYLEPGGIIAWLVVGLIAGWAAGRAGPTLHRPPKFFPAG